MLIIQHNYNMHYNDEVININYVGFLGLILLFKISVGTRKNFFGINGQFVHAPSKFPQLCSTTVCHTKK